MTQRSRNLEDALELAEIAERMVRARVRREHPSYDDERVERDVLAWLHDRPGAEHGDAVGRVVEAPSQTRSG